MSGRYVDMDMSGFKEFFNRMERAAKGDFRKELETFLEGLGNEFLRILQDEIVRRKVMDSRQLLASFERGNDGNVWRIEEGGLVLEVGTSVNYAAYVNDGHWTNTTGVERRFIPGDVELGPNGKVISFKYNPSAKGGIMLKQHWVKGKHYWDSALRILNKMYPELLEARLQDWLDSYFGKA